jgi:hypothetical protein
MIKANIIDRFKSHSLKIEEDGSLNAYIIPRPPLEVDQQVLPFAQYMKLNGTGSQSMLVNGSTTPQDFYVGAQEYDVYVNSIIFVIADANALLNQFGAITALTNGLEFYYYNQTNGKYTIESGLKTNFDMVRLANFKPSFGTANDAMRFTNVTGASEAFVGVIDIEDVFGLQWGLKLRANTTDRIGFIINDNLTAIDLMDVKVYGIRV